MLLRHEKTREYAGCVRLVHRSVGDSTRPLPFELTCAETLYPEARELLQGGCGVRTGEISRLAVRHRFRRRTGDTAPIGKGPVGDGAGRRRAPSIAMDLYVATAACSGLEAGLDRVFALMEPRLSSKRTGFGIQFRQMGDPVEHRGMGAPYYIDRQMLFDGLQPRVRALLEVVTRDLRRGRRRA